MIKIQNQTAPFANHYPAARLLLEKGQGCNLYDNAGKRYLDFGSGLVVNALGHGRRDLAQIASEQMQKLIHASNLYLTAPALKLARQMTIGSPFAAVFFGNSGTEAVEAALKYARLFAGKRKGPGHHKLHCFTNGFHGRSLGALSVTPKLKYQRPFQPLLAGVTVSDLNNEAQLAGILDDSYAAVIVEVIQGEGGLDSLSPDFAGQLNALCRKHDVMLIVDEIQTGLARTGSFYAHTAVGLEPDILCLSKALAGGLPLSATLIKDTLNAELKPGSHNSTFGGGPVTTAVASHVWDLLSAEDFIAAVAAKGCFLKQLLKDLQQDFSLLGKIKGKGLLMGIEFLPGTQQLDAFIQLCQQQGLLVLRSGENILRIAPPLVISEKELSSGMDIIRNVIKQI